MLCGIIHTSSHVIYGFNAKGIPRKKFSPVDRDNGHLYVSIKISSPYDTYAIVKPEHISDGIQIGSLVQIIGTVGDINIERLYLQHRIKCNWKNIKYTESSTPDIERDIITNIPVISIDPINCTDIDDALHIRQHDNATEIGIHIADVTSYIPIDSPLDNEIASRSTSAYLENVQINMLPSILSTNHCSLLEGNRKKCHSVIITYIDMEIVNVKIIKRR